MTFHNVRNYGAMLQAFSLWKFLSDRGHDVRFLNYPWPTAQPPRFPKKLINRYFQVDRLGLDLFYSQRMTGFASQLPVTERVKSNDEMIGISKNWDVAIVGSDQMWNPNWTPVESFPLVFLDFACSGVKRLAYAVSWGVRSWDRLDAPKVGDLLRKFTAISVRESSGVSLVKELSGLDSEVMPDPTLLHDAGFYRRLFDGEQTICGRYVFKYFVRDFATADVDQVAFRIGRKELGITRVVSDRQLPSGMFSKILCLLAGVRPQSSVVNWLSRLSGSEFVVTNSFHGTVFSVLFHRPFVSLLVSGKLSGMNERISSLLHMVGLENRMAYVDEVEKISAICKRPIDWNLVDERLSDIRLKAEGFFRSQDL